MPRTFCTGAAFGSVGHDESWNTRDPFGEATTMILKRNVLSAALASAILMTATGVYAQPAGQTQDNGQATSQKAAQKSNK
jgi:hypothetical protein